MIYLDNAASTWPKPPGVAEAVKEMVANNGANPGRGTHKMAMQAARVVARARSAVATLFGVRNPEDLIFTHNATEALNMAIFGLLKPGDHVVTTMLEHNSVRRPLEALRRRGWIEVTYVQSTENGIAPEEVRAAFRSDTRLLAVTHASNVLGTLVDIDAMTEIAHANGAFCLVDAAQTAGSFPIDVTRSEIDLLAVPGHKGLFGPQGTGALYIRPGLELEPFLYGGTGSHSEEPDQPLERPIRYESGTLNTPGLAGLAVGAEFVSQIGPSAIGQHNQALIQSLREGLESLPGIKFTGPGRGEPRADLLAFSLRGVDSTELAVLLSDQYEIAVRSGLHCSPLAHQVAGTLDEGLVRVSVSWFNTENDIRECVAAIRELADFLRDG
ncbi:aminotransferase class V-fold PLP-dependent enzyme [Kyrpidia sp.]|uniref:aminotransferase class V-fold PLP-dependent enzyme n=1 Tax=Kyrpidia sp. TaxID=2073077 RepID=UPI00258EC5D9|nr:aminotransferase class V-fold PLP-dependent enzyme [Kyrpidia sp.]MCL6576882.1 aminotransferase class V-fold PLP-dependent enzyme [Kyrpidia sp.]